MTVSEDNRMQMLAAIPLSKKAQFGGSFRHPPMPQSSDRFLAKLRCDSSTTRGWRGRAAKLRRKTPTLLKTHLSDRHRQLTQHIS